MREKGESHNLGIGTESFADGPFFLSTFFNLSGPVFINAVEILDAS
jgi:hypothetical protein